MSEHTPSPAPDAAHPDYGEHNVLAVFGGMEQARKVIEELELAGVEANSISLLGRPSDDAAVSDTERQRQSDQAVFGEAGRGAGAGAAAGAGVGGAAGFLAGAAAFGIPGVGPVVGAGIWAATLGGAAAGAGVGFTAGGIGSIKESEAWSLSFESVREGKVVVGVHGPDRGTIEQAAETFEGHGAERVETFDVEGTRRL